MREGCREELTVLRQTQRMAAAVDPPLSPHSAPSTHTPVYYVKEGIGGLL